MIKVEINGIEYAAIENETILETADRVGIHIPTLCHFNKLCEGGLCRICVVKVLGEKQLKPACATTVREGMVIKTNCDEVSFVRRKTLDLICENHRMECEYCTRYSDCELHELLTELGMDDNKYISSYRPSDEDISSPIFIRDNSKCILCRRCVTICDSQNVSAIGALGIAARTHIGAVLPMTETECLECGKCVAVCPTGALRIKSDVGKVWNLFRATKKNIIAVVSPHIFSALGAYMHLEDACGVRLSAFLRAIGFKRVYILPDVCYTYGDGPQISSICRPAVTYIKSHYSKYAGLLDDSYKHLERVKYDAEKKYCDETNTPHDECASVLITTCAADKSGSACYDAVLTARELVSFLNQASVSKYTMLEVWRTLKPIPVDVLYNTDTELKPLRLEGTEAIDSMLKRGEFISGIVEPLICANGCEGGGGQIATIGR